MTHGWWQRLGSNCLRVMEAATEAKRQGKEQRGDNKFTCVHDKFPVLSPARANLTGQNLIHPT
jgi:hypothetical protein